MQTSKVRTPNWTAAAAGQDVSEGLGLVVTTSNEALKDNFCKKSAINELNAINKLKIVKCN